MTPKKFSEPDLEGIAKFKYDLLKWSAFCAPPTIIYIGWFAVFRDIWLALGLTVVCIVSFLVAVAYWYYKQTTGAKLAKE